MDNIILIIHGSMYALHSHHEQWINKYWTTAPKGNTSSDVCEPQIVAFLSTTTHYIGYIIGLSTSILIKQASFISVENSFFNITFFLYNAKYVFY